MGPGKSPVSRVIVHDRHGRFAFSSFDCSCQISTLQTCCYRSPLSPTAEDHICEAQCGFTTWLSNPLRLALAVCTVGFGFKIFVVRQTGDFKLLTLRRLSLQILSGTRHLYLLTGNQEESMSLDGVPVRADLSTYLNVRHSERSYTGCAERGLEQTPCQCLSRAGA